MMFNVADENIKVNISRDSKVSFSDGTFDSKFDLFREFKEYKSSLELTYMTDHWISWSEVPKLKKIKSELNNWKIGHSDQCWLFQYTSDDTSKYPYEISFWLSKITNQSSVCVRGLTTQQFATAQFPALSLLSTDQAILSRLLLDKQGALLHGNCVKIGNKTLLILGDSGSGKSTLCQMLENAGASWITDDRTIIRLVNNQVICYGSWLHGSHKVINDSKNKLDGILLLEKSKKNFIGEKGSPWSKRDVLLGSIIKPIMLPNEWPVLLQTVLTLQILPFRVLRFNLETNGEEQFELLNKERFI